MSSPSKDCDLTKLVSMDELCHQIDFLGGDLGIGQAVLLNSSIYHELKVQKLLISAHFYDDERLEGTYDFHISYLLIFFSISK